jgi:hypothetical protein
MFGNVKNLVRKIGFAAAAFALAAGIASAPVASAGPLLSSGKGSLSTPLVRETGSLKVYVGFVPEGTTQQATVAVYDEYGQGVAKALAHYGSELSFDLSEGIYKLRITAKGYRPAGEVVKVAANSTTYVKIALQSSSSTPPPASLSN